MSTEVLSPFPLFTSRIGEPLNLGYVYIGIANQDPETHPQQAYWDIGLTTPATQPLRTDGGFIVNTGNPSNVYTADAFSIRVRDRNGVLVFFRANVPDADALRDELFSAAGAGMIGFSHAETYPAGTLGAKGRQVVSVMDAPFNAKGDGVTDDTAAIQAALDTDRDVFFPATTSYYKISARLQSSADGQRIYGTGKLSRIVQSGTGNDANVFTFTHDDLEFTGLNLTPGTTSLASLGHGWGIIGNGGDRALIHDNRVSGMRRGGVALYNSSNSVVRGNVFTASVVVNPSPTNPADSQGNMGYDVFLAENSSYCLVEGNQCVSGCGVGVGCQTVTGDGSSTQRGHVITANVIKDQPCYGIMVYKSGTDPLLAHITIANNFIMNISGSVYTDGATLFYGCGIYVTAGQGIAITGNYVFNTNSDRSLPRSGSDVPAGIGISGYGQATVSGNYILRSYHGVMTVQAGTTGGTGDGVVVAGNYIDVADFVGVYAIDSINAIVADNRINGNDATSETGVWVRKVASAQMDCTSVTGNQIRGFISGIVGLDGPPELLAVSNTIRGATTYGIYSSAPKTVINSNDVSASTGIVLSSAAVRGSVNDNTIQATVEINNGSTAIQPSGNKFSAGANRGTAQLTTGTVTLLTAEIRTGDRISLQRRTPGGTIGIDLVAPTASVTNGTSFVVNAVSAAGAVVNTDTSTFDWSIDH